MTMQPPHNQPPLPDPRNAPPSYPPNSPPQGYAGYPNPHADGTGGIIPYKNPSALTSYYVGLFSLIPFLGLVMGPAAVILGVKGLRYAKEHPAAKGKVHAYVGIACGGFWTIIYWGLAILAVIGALASR